MLLEHFLHSIARPQREHTAYKLQVTSYKLQVTSYKLQVITASKMEKVESAIQRELLNINSELIKEADDCRETIQRCVNMIPVILKDKKGMERAVRRLACQQYPHVPRLWRLKQLLNVTCLQLEDNFATITELCEKVDHLREEQIELFQKYELAIGTQRYNIRDTLISPINRNFQPEEQDEEESDENDAEEENENIDEDEDEDEDDDEEEDEFEPSN